MTKAELENEIKSLKQQLSDERKRPTGHVVSNCRIDMNDPAKQAVAEAVKEGMKALQSLYNNNQRNYGIFLGGNDDV